MARTKTRMLGSLGPRKAISKIAQPRPQRHPEWARPYISTFILAMKSEGAGSFGLSSRVWQQGTEMPSPLNGLACGKVNHRAIHRECDMERNNTSDLQHWLCTGGCVLRPSVMLNHELGTCELLVDNL